MFFKKRIKEKEYIPSPRSDYSFTMDYINFTLEFEKSAKDKIDMIEFFMEMIRKDIQYDLMSKFIYNKMDNIEISHPFPIDYFIDTSDFQNKAILVREDKVVDLSKDTVILLPWDRYAFSVIIKSMLNNGFIYSKTNHRGYYFSDIDLCYVYNGNHSIATGIIKREGQIKVKEYDIKNLFKDLITDGLHWYINGEKQINEVFDFRIAILYEIAKIKYNLTNNSLKL